ncbi:MAG: hypothetical protein H6807_05635 [Planctomycetes bacterium]|nr:hypothetical protein [Planctomycetota bacterium]
MFRSLALLSTLALVFVPFLVAEGGPRPQDEGRRRAARADDFPTLLSETGFYADVAGKTFAPGLLPYEIIAPLWTDGAQKERFILLPKEGKLRWGDDGRLVFPEGTRFMFTIFIEEDGDRLYLESRMIEIRGRRLHFATYQWREDQKEADRVREGSSFYANYGKSSQLWKITADDRCQRCHSRASELILGFKPAQLDRPVTITGESRNQLEHWARLGVLEGLPADRSALPHQADYRDTSLDLETRARSYLDVNCGVCHVPGGHGSGTLDLRATTPMHLTGMIRISEDFTLDDGVLVPGDAENSMLTRRMLTVSDARMPDELSTVQDMTGIRLLQAWIDQR